MAYIKWLGLCLCVWVSVASCECECSGGCFRVWVRARARRSEANARKQKERKGQLPTRFIAHRCAFLLELLLLWLFIFSPLAGDGSGACCWHVVALSFQFVFVLILVSISIFISFSYSISLSLSPLSYVRCPLSSVLWRSGKRKCCGRCFCCGFMTFFFFV